jgi:DNA-binding transcriptional LysR family regulator
LIQTDYVAVMPNRVAQRYREALSIDTLPFELPIYHLLLCWNRRAGNDPGVLWLKDELLRIGRTIR